MKYLIPLIAALVLISSGCKKNETTPAGGASGAQPAATDNSATPAPSAPVPAALPTAHVNARAENDLKQEVTGTVDPFLTEQLHVFIRQKGRMPQNFSEFAAARLDSVPRPPEGCKWAIDSANQQVKAVK